jgi:hypothetical protein
MTYPDEYFDEPEFHCCSDIINQEVLDRKGKVWRIGCRVCKSQWSQEE